MNQSHPSTALISNSDPASSMREAERILGYHFHKPSLLKEALTHSSFSDGTISYKRLEVVGDAALYLAMTNYLYLSNPGLGPGPISRLRSANLTNEKLARVAVRHNIYPLVLHSSPLLDKQVEEFTKAVMQEPEEDQIYGGSTKKAPKVLADVVEAIAAAIYEDSDFDLDVMWKVVRILLKPLITDDTFSKQPVTAKKSGKEDDTFSKQPVTAKKSGKEDKFPTQQNGSTTIVEVPVDGESVSSGSAEQMKIAKLNAANIALEKLCGEISNLLKSQQHKKVGDEAGYNVTVEDRAMRERYLPCCGIGIGWLLFILGFFLAAIPWYVGAIMLCFSRVDYREKPGYIGCTIAFILATIAVIIWNDKRS